MNEQNSKPIFTAKVSNFILELYLIIVALAFGYSVENLVSSAISLSSIVRFLTVVIMLTIWLHGQIGYASSQTYEVGHSWFGRVIEHYIEVASVILMMSAALVQANEIIFYGVVLATYAFDMLLEFVYGIRVKCTNDEYNSEKKVAQTWLYVDMISVVLFSIILIMRLNYSVVTEAAASVSFFIVVLILTFWDYFYNRDYYFGIPKDVTSNQPNFTKPTMTHTIDLRIMTFNIWVGGEIIDLNKIIEAIISANADVVGLQEAGGNTCRIANALGWLYASEQMHIISRFPLITPPDSDGTYIFVQIRPKEVVALANLHLPSDPYGPYAVQNGATLAAVLELERVTRLPILEKQLTKLSKLAELNIPVFLMGDFNSPSHLDWIEEVVGIRPQVKYAVEWPVSLAIEGAGFQDTYRAIYPDPVSRPGITWTHGYPYPQLRPNETFDRIDMIYALGDFEILDSQIIGEAGLSYIDIGVTGFSSDHCSLVSTIRTTPGCPPLFVSPERRSVKHGMPFVVRYYAPEGEEHSRIVIVPKAGDVQTNALMWLPPYEASFWGSVTFGTTTLQPNEYEVVLVNTKNQELSRVQFWIVSPNAHPIIKVDKTSYENGEPITISWQNTSGNRKDWIGIYRSGDANLYSGYRWRIYTDGQVAGQVTIENATIKEIMVSAGEYEARLLLDDGYALLATSKFTIKV